MEYGNGMDLIPWPHTLEEGFFRLHLATMYRYVAGSALHARLQSVLTYKHKGFRLQPWMCLFWNEELHSNEVPISS